MLAVIFGLIATAALIALGVARMRLRELVDATRSVVEARDKRLPAASLSGDVAVLAQYFNALAETADNSRLALAREHMLLAAVADGLTQGVIALDGARRIEMMNEAARAILGMAERSVGESLLELVRVPELLTLVDGPATSAEVQLPSGSRALIRVARSEDRGGCVLLLEDVTAMRRLETMRRDFVANVSHELRTPVAVIRANAETLMAGAKNDPQIAGRLIDGLHRNAERLARILADLLDLSRLDAGQYRLEIAPTEIRTVTEQSLSAVELQAQSRGVAIDVDVADAPAVHADPKALDQVLVNLIENAIKYTNPQGRVWIEASEVDSDVRIAVRDDGPGISEKHRERVFERFYRADPSRSREAGGTGLGLSIVKHLVESMGGTVGVEPNVPRGCIFWFTLPKVMHDDDTHEQGLRSGAAHTSRTPVRHGRAMRAANSQSDAGVDRARQRASA